jgi:hypothetical protein
VEPLQIIASVFQKLISNKLNARADHTDHHTDIIAPKGVVDNLLVYRTAQNWRKRNPQMEGRKSAVSSVVCETTQRQLVGNDAISG